MAEETKNYLLEEDNETSGFDYKAFLIKLLMYWPWILGSIAVFLIGAFFLPQDPDPSLHRQFFRVD